MFNFADDNGKNNGSVQSRKRKNDKGNSSYEEDCLVDEDCIDDNMNGKGDKQKKKKENFRGNAKVISATSLTDTSSKIACFSFSRMDNVRDSLF